MNGETFPSLPYRPDFREGLYSREYNDLFYNTGIAHDNVGNLITHKQYGGGSYILAFDLSPDLCNGFHNHSQKTGNIELDMTFANPLPDGITIIVYGSFDVEIQIDRNKSAKVVYI